MVSDIITHLLWLLYVNMHYFALPIYVAGRSIIHVWALALWSIWSHYTLSFIAEEVASITAG